MSTPNEWPRPISERPTPAMVEGLRLRHAHGSTRAGLVSRRLACPGGRTKAALSLTPLGQWVREILLDLVAAQAHVERLRTRVIEAESESAVLRRELQIARAS